MRLDSLPTALRARAAAGERTVRIHYQQIEEAAVRRTDVHHSRVRMVSITQSTELGTVYSAEEIAAIGDTTDRLGLRLHMDGARFANAVAALGVPPRTLTWEAGVDVLTFGGTKNGLAGGEALVFFDRHLARDFAYRRKQSGQLASKMRFLAAPWTGRAALIARGCAACLRTPMPWRRPWSEDCGPCRVWKLFIRARPMRFLPDSLPRCSRVCTGGAGSFTQDVGPSGAARLMCSWDTKPEDVAGFVRDAGELAGLVG